LQGLFFLFGGTVEGSTFWRVFFVTAIIALALYIAFKT
jgi:hypothetical protein